MKSNLLEIPGSMLIPSFSVYLYHFKHPLGDYYYVGMTGDNYYPSARSAIHRLSGHFELQKRSTQNQLNKKIIELGGEQWIKDVIITYRHWPINGFAPILRTEEKFNPEMLDSKQQEAYKMFKLRRNQVLQLEQHLIIETAERFGARCWNKAIKRVGSAVPIEFKAIVDEFHNFIR
jgi:hypothetical protein